MNTNRMQELREYAITRRAEIIAAIARHEQTIAEQTARKVASTCTSTDYLAAQAIKGAQNCIAALLREAGSL